MRRISSRGLAIVLVVLALPATGLSRETTAEVAPSRASPAAPTENPEPVATDDESARSEARALVARAFEHVYEGEHALALEKFRHAHRVYPSPKILLNIGTTLKKLGRYAESSAVYERYLTHPETDPTRRAEVRRELEGALARVARLQIEVNVEGARILVDGKAVSLDDRHQVRVDPGAHTVVAEKEGYETRTLSAFDLDTGETRTVRLGLISHQERQLERERERALAFERGQAAAIEALAPRSIDTGGRFGAMAAVAVAVQEPAASALVGLSYGLTSRIDVEVQALLGDEYGAYAGGRFFATTDRVRLSVSAGSPMFFVRGVRPGIRGGVGGGLLISDNVGVSVDLGVEHYFSLPEDLQGTLFVPRLAIEGRL